MYRNEKIEIHSDLDTVGLTLAMSTGCPVAENEFRRTTLRVGVYVDTREQEAQKRLLRLQLVSTLVTRTKLYGSRRALNKF